MISGVMSSGVRTMAAASQQLQAASHTVAAEGVANIENLTKAMVGAQQAQGQAEIGAKMIETGNELLGNVIDAFA